MFEILQQILREHKKRQDTRPVIPSANKRQAMALLESGLFDEGVGTEQAILEFVEKISAQLTATSGPRYWGFVTGGRTPAALVGDMLTGLYDQNLMTPDGSIAPALEQQAIRWLLELVELSSNEFKGTFTTGATAANLLGLACARQWFYQSFDILRQGLFQCPPMKVFGTNTHFSVAKSMSVLGLGSDNFYEVPALAGSDIMDCDALDAILSEHAAEKVVVVAGAGKVNTGSFDDIATIAKLCKKYKAWLHVDAAFGLFARCSKRHMLLTDGMDQADSIATDAHKWLNVPYDCGLFLTKHPALQQEAFSVNASYMFQPSISEKNGPVIPNALKGIEGSQRFRALPVWMSLLAYGKSGYQQFIQKSCLLAEMFANNIETSEFYELICPVTLNIVLFRAVKNTSKAFNEKLLQMLHDSGEVFLTSASHDGKFGMRAAFCNFETDETDVTQVIEVLSRCGKELLDSS